MVARPSSNAAIAVHEAARRFNHPISFTNATSGPASTVCPPQFGWRLDHGGLIPAPRSDQAGERSREVQYGDEQNASLLFATNGCAARLQCSAIDLRAVAEAAATVNEIAFEDDYKRLLRKPQETLETAE